MGSGRTLRIRRRRAGSVDDTTDAIRAVACIRFVRRMFIRILFDSLQSLISVDEGGLIAARTGNFCHLREVHIMLGAERFLNAGERRDVRGVHGNSGFAMAALIRILFAFVVCLLF